MPFALSDILSKEAVLSDLQAMTKHGVLQELLAPLVALHPDQVNASLISALEQREKLGTTSVGNGVAIPHSKVSGLTSILLAVGRSKSGIHFSSQEQELTHIFFLILAPINGAGMHLRLLAQVSRLSKDPVFRSQFLQAKDSSELYQLVTTP